MNGMVTNERLGRSRPDLRQQHIIETARVTFMSEGFAATTMSAIAERLGGSKATLYKYFPSKEALFEAVVRNGCEAFLVPLREARDIQGDIESWLTSFGTSFLKALYSPPALGLHRLVQAEGRQFPGLARIFFALGPDPAYRQLAERIDQETEKGTLRCKNAELFAQQFLAMLRGDRHLRVICGVAKAPSSREISEQVSLAVSVTLRGMLN